MSQKLSKTLEAPKRINGYSLTTQNDKIRVSLRVFDLVVRRKKKRRKKKYISRLKVNSTPVYASLCPSLVPHERSTAASRSSGSASSGGRSIRRGEPRGSNRLSFCSLEN